jgi:hypothetical protein
MPSFHTITPTVDLTPGIGVGLGTWRDIDASSYIPDNATGVIIHCVSGPTDPTKPFGLRKNGSTDNRTDIANTGSHWWAVIGVDDDGIFEFYRENSAQHIYIVGYTTAGVTMFTNSVNYDGSVAASNIPGTWYDVDISETCPSAVGVIVEFTGSLPTVAMRKKGSTDDRTVSGYFAATHMWFIIGVDSNQVFQVKITSAGITFHIDVVGYITSGAVFNTNVTDISLSSTGSYVEIDLSSECPLGSMAIIEIENSTYPPPDKSYALRKKDETGDDVTVYNYSRWHEFAVVALDEDGILEGKVSNLGVDFYLVGYSTGTTPLVATKAATAVLSTTATLNGYLADDGGASCIVRFEWGTDTSYGNTTGPQYKNTGHYFSQGIAGLTPGTEYHFRAKATNIFGTTYGLDMAFIFGWSGITYPESPLTRVTGIRHYYRPGLLRMVLSLGDVGRDIEIAESTVREELAPVPVAPPKGPFEIRPPIGIDYPGPQRRGPTPPEPAPTPPKPKPKSWIEQMADWLGFIWFAGRRD